MPGTVRVKKAGDDEGLSAAFALLLQQRIGALLVAADAYFDTRRERIVAFAAQNRLPAVYHFREYAFAGGLVSYGPSVTDAYRQVGIYTGRIIAWPGPHRSPGRAVPSMTAPTAHIRQLFAGKFLP
jgi:putative ABC transport system substrate-binding protein